MLAVVVLGRDPGVVGARFELAVWIVVVDDRVFGRFSTVVITFSRRRIAVRHVWGLGGHFVNSLN